MIHIEYTNLSMEGRKSKLSENMKMKWKFCGYIQWKKKEMHIIL